MNHSQRTVYLYIVLISHQERDSDLEKEEHRQEENDMLRKQFAQAANAFHSWLTQTRWVSLSPSPVDSPDLITSTVLGCVDHSHVLMADAKMSGFSCRVYLLFIVIQSFTRVIIF